MAYKFVGSSNQYLSAAAPLTGAPLTVSAWFRIDNTTGNKAIVALETGNDAHRFVLYVANNQLFWFVNSTAFAQVMAGGGSISENTWWHGCAVESASNSRTAYGNGTAGSVETTSRTPLNIDELNIGIDRVNNSLSGAMTGQIADVGVWNVALTAAEIASLAKGVSCRRVRPQSLVFYAPLIRQVIDQARAATITNNNAATVEIHPRIYA